MVKGITLQFEGDKDYRAKLLRIQKALNQLGILFETDESKEWFNGERLYLITWELDGKLKGADVIDKLTDSNEYEIR